MSHGGLPPRRPDQIDAPTPRIPVPGARTTPIVNKPGTTVTVHDGGVVNAKSVQGYANDGGSSTLIASTNPNGVQLWSLTMSSFVGSASASGVNQTDDTVKDSTGVIYGALESGMAGSTASVTASASFDLKGVTVPAGRSITLQNGSTSTTHRTSAVLLYTTL